MLFSTGSKIGAKIDVEMPVKAMATPPMASCTGLTLAQALAPKPWLEAPMASPAAISFLMPKSLSSLWLKVAPSIPVKITPAVVRAGMPPMVLDTSMAIGVVTDLGMRLSSTFSLAPKPLALKYITTMATTVAIVTPPKIGRAFS